MKRKMIIAALSSLLVLQQIIPAGYVYASEYVNKDHVAEENERTNIKVYVEDGEGSTSEGKGTKDSPYQNIRTALSNIQEGETLVLVGTVKYTKYQADTDGSVIPLMINKRITIEGADESSGLNSRATIQLGANVTMRNMRLELIPEISLGGTSSESKILGQQVARSTTIFLAGHELVIDNVNTRVGTNPDQYDDRPFISGVDIKHRKV